MDYGAFVMVVCGEKFAYTEYETNINLHYLQYNLEQMDSIDLYKNCICAYVFVLICGYIQSSNEELDKSM